VRSIDPGMTIIYNLEELDKPLTNPVLTIGNFDGVHRGHLALFDKVKERARNIDGQSALMTFEPHPLKVMMPENSPPLITPTHQKLKLIEDAGVDVVFCITFNKEFAAISAQEFIHTLLVDKIGIKELVVGYDYAFGYRRQGNIALLREMGNRLGFEVHVVEPVRLNHTLVSSTSIRELVQEGNLSEAKELLGRDYQICGKVVKGKNRGARLLGFPTANLELVDELIPKRGVYAVRVTADDRTYNGLTNIGYNPTFGEGSFSVETHLLDFSGDLFGKTMKVNFIARIRDEKTFRTPKDLGDQIARDVRKATELLGKSRNLPSK
jgi:riboflavin kinase/FMN adenylyltransferase